MNIKEKRMAKGLLQSDVMEDVSLYSKIENGKAISTPGDSERFAELFGCEIPELFTGDELSFFGGLSEAGRGAKAKDGKLLAKEDKIVASAVCKPPRRHLGFIRKCYWLNKTRNEEFSGAISRLGYRTAQAWFSAMVDETIEQAREGEKEYYLSDYMGKEECK